MVNITTPLNAPGEVRDVYITEGNRYAVVATASGAEILNLLTGSAVSFGTIPSYEVLCVAVDWTTVTGSLYVGTSGGGIFSTPYYPARKSFSDFSGSLVQHFSTTSSPPISDDVVTDLSVLSGSLLIGTASGVDFVSGKGYSTLDVVEGTNAVHLTESGGYWTTTSSVEVNYDLISTTGTGIIDIDFAYTLSSTPSIRGEPPVDIAVSNSAGNFAVLAFATSGGVTVLEERLGSEASAQTKEPAGEDILSVDFSDEASFDDGFLYYTTASTLSVLHLTNDTISGTHTVSEGTRDQTLVTGTVTVVRTTDVA